MALNIVIENVPRAPDKQQKPMSIAITLEWPRYRADSFSLAWRATLLTLVILLLGACSSLPSQGPVPGAPPPSPLAPPPPQTAPEIYLQAGAFAVRANAERLSQRIAAAAPQRAVQVREGGMIAGRALYRVRVGPLSGVEGVDRLTRELSAIGIKAAQVVID